MLPAGAIEEEIAEDINDTKRTASFLHLHVGIDAAGIDVGSIDTHYTVMRKGWDQPCGEGNMVAVSIPSVLDPSLAPEGCHIIHAYAAGNEDWETWAEFDGSTGEDGRAAYRKSQAYQDKKAERAEILWSAIESIIPDARRRAQVAEVGTPLTHKRFNRRFEGTYV